MRLSQVIFAAAMLASSAIATPTDTSIEAILCGTVNGNCYENGCAGDKSPGGITCTAGQWRGCPCGYGCGKNTGKCNANGCNGSGNRCTKNYRGCSCND
ncbi:hypothetical protein BT63DRAFT_428989 [Microthyrium microscopicum]|uniref:Uncharacterized protein n=1 Tax=Microthyrium microscopicum TaxID=703497 RepID=A0A6A6U1N4_9PEZI|nr:hypothetical protein BT63DRAFT_428989 [Microthyrium microscopicum]